MTRNLPILNQRPFRPIVYWYVSLRCNLACKHCWVNSSPSVDTSGDLTSREMLRTVERIADFGTKAVILTGGEPLLRPDIDMIIEGLVDRGVATHIETNAMLISDEVVAIAQRTNATGGRVDFAVSLDGGTAQAHDWCRGRGSYVETVAGLRKLRSAGLPADIQCVITRRNWDTIPQLVALARELEVAYLKFVLASPVGRANHFTNMLSVPYEQSGRAVGLIFEAIRDYPGQVLLKIPPAMIPPGYLPEFKKHRASGCVQNVTSCSFPLLGILPDGSVTICAASRERPEAYFGNVREKSLKEIWQSQRLDNLRERYVTGTELTGICGDCVFRSECRGACRAHAFAEEGDFMAPYPVCAEMERTGNFPPLYRRSALAALQPEPV